MDGDSCCCIILGAVSTRLYTGMLAWADLLIVLAKAATYCCVVNIACLILLLVMVTLEIFSFRVRILALFFI